MADADVTLRSMEQSTEKSLEQIATSLGQIAQILHEVFPEAKQARGQMSGARRKAGFRLFGEAQETAKASPPARSPRARASK
jgi:hypothetical protein